MADRNPSKKRRQSQNRADREARSARSAAADRVPGSVTSGSPDSPDSPVSSGSVFSRKRRGAAASGTSGRPTRTASGVARATGTTARPSRAAATKARPAATKADAKGTSGSSTSTSSTSKARRPTPPKRPLPPWFDRFGLNEPGGRMILFAFVLTLIASIAACFMNVVAFTETNVATGKQEVTKSVTALHWGIGRGLAIVGPAPVAVGLAILLARPPNRRRTWYFGAAALFLVTMTSGFLYLAAFGVMAWGCWQARGAALAEVGGDSKALRQRDREALRRQGRRRRGEDEDVIEPDLVDDEPVDDDDDLGGDPVAEQKSRWGRNRR